MKWRFASFALLTVGISATGAIYLHNLDASWLWPALAVAVPVGLPVLGFFFNEAVKRQIKIIVDGLLSTRVSTTATFFILTLIQAGLIEETVRAWPLPSDYVSITVYHGKRLQGYFATGTQVLLHTDRNAITRERVVGNDGVARFDGILQNTNAQIYIREIKDEHVRIWGADSFTINTLPVGKHYDIAAVADKDWEIISPTPASTADPVSGVVHKVAYAWPSTKAPKSVKTFKFEVMGAEGLLDSNAPWGVPPAQITINRYAYVLGFDSESRSPKWVAYAAAAFDGEVPRPSYKLDPAVPFSMQASNSDYTRSGYDRGHLVTPRDVIYKGKLAVVESNYLSTLTPQIPRVNRTTWYALERRARELSAQLGREVYIQAGPIMDAGDSQRVGPKDIAVPAQFFRIITWQNEGDDISSAAYIIPNTSQVEIDFQAYATTIKDVEQRTGLRFFPNMEPGLYERLAEQVGRLP